MFREGARVHDPLDMCPLCSKQSCWFASDFRVMGKHSLRVCINCKSVSINGEKKADLEVHLIPPAQGRDAEAPG